MPNVQKRVRKSKGGRWTDQQRDLLLRLANRHPKVPWKQIQARYFPDRTVEAITKQYSDITKGHKNGETMSRRNNIHNNVMSPRTLRAAAKNPPNYAGLDVSDESAQRQPRAAAPQREPESASEDTDSTDEDGIAILNDGTHTLKRKRLSSATSSTSTESGTPTPSDTLSDTGNLPRPSMTVKLPYNSSKKGKSPAEPITIDQPEPPTIPPPAQPSPQRTVPPRNGEPSTSSIKPPVESSKASSPIKSVGGKDTAGDNEAPTDGYDFVIRNAKSLITVMENERKRRCSLEQKIRDLSKALGSAEDKAQTSETALQELRGRLESKEATISQERSSSPNVPRSCPTCVKERARRAKMLQVRGYLRDILSPEAISD